MCLQCSVMLAMAFAASYFLRLLYRTNGYFMVVLLTGIYDGYSVHHYCFHGIVQGSIVIYNV